MNRILVRTYQLATALLVGSAGIAMLPGELWLADLLANVVVHIAIAGIVLTTVGTLSTREPRYLLPLLSSVPALIAVGAALAAAPAAEVQRGFSFSVVTYNVGAASPGSPASLRYLRRQDADLVVLQEYSSEWSPVVDALGDVLPYSLTEARGDNFGIAVLSKHRLEIAAIGRFRPSEVPYGRVELHIGATRLTFIGVHLEWPVFPESHAMRNAQAKELAALVASSDRPVVVCGDFNLTPYSRTYASFRRASGVHDVAGPARLAGTWPASLPGLRIPIDHCFAGGGARLLDKSRGPDVGSDHLPVLYTVAAGSGA